LLPKKKKKKKKIFNTKFSLQKIKNKPVFEYFDSLTSVGQCGDNPVHFSSASQSSTAARQI
jgi:hypothetical protein